MEQFLKSQNGKSMIRVNQAGEAGAIRIYQGQITALKLKKDLTNLELFQEMLQQEQKHCQYFNELSLKTRTSPTKLQPIWHFGGFALGFVTAMISSKVAMTCTVAVEEVIENHYEEQLQNLKSQQLENSELAIKIKEFQQEECEHRDLGYLHHAKESKIFQPLRMAISNITKIAIAVSKKI